MAARCGAMRSAARRRAARREPRSYELVVRARAPRRDVTCARAAMANRLAVDTEKLIRSVQATPCLWNPKNPHYFKRDYQRVAWLKVADEINAPVDELKKRWRGLRDTFGREQRRLSATALLEQRCPWRHFSRLLFLRDVVTDSRKNGRPKRHGRGGGGGTGASIDDDASLKRNYCDADAIDDEDMNATDADEGCSSPEGADTDDAATVINRLQAARSLRLERPESPARGRSPASGGSAATAAAERADDADAQFLLSLLPFLQDVPKKRKLMVRARLTQVLMDEQNQPELPTD